LSLEINVRNLVITLTKVLQFNLGLTLIRLAKEANNKVEYVSSKLISSELIQAQILILFFPLSFFKKIKIQKYSRDCCNILVSLLSLKGTWDPGIFSLSALRAAIQWRSARSDLFINFVSSIKGSISALFLFSIPTKSTIDNTLFEVCFKNRKNF